MPIVAVAVCPHPPALVPGVAPGTDEELADLRAACLAAVDRLADAAPDELLVLGAAATSREYPADTPGSFAAYGAPDVIVSPGAGPGLPLPLLVGAWLVQRTPRLHDIPVTTQTIVYAASPADCLQLGRDLSTHPARRALLVMGDGAARHSEHSPVHLHPRAEVFDATVADALAKADADTLAALDPDLAAELSAQGRAAWQILAGAAADGTWSAELLHAANPYGVGYVVATWHRT